MIFNHDPYLIRLPLLAAQAARLKQIDLTPLLVYLLDMIEASALPWLAEQLALTGVNGWHLAESAITLHRYKGTPWSSIVHCAQIFCIASPCELNIVLSLSISRPASQPRINSPRKSGSFPDG